MQRVLLAICHRRHVICISMFVCRLLDIMQQGLIFSLTEIQWPHIYQSCLLLGPCDSLLNVFTRFVTSKIGSNCAKYFSAHCIAFLQLLSCVAMCLVYNCSSLSFTQSIVLPLLFSTMLVSKVQETKTLTTNKKYNKQKSCFPFYHGINWTLKMRERAIYIQVAKLQSFFTWQMHFTYMYLINWEYHIGCFV